MKRLPTHALFALLALAALAACAAVDETEVSFETLDQGTQSGIVRQRFEVVRDSDGFAALWTELTSTLSPAPELPAVDFEEEMVIAAFAGEYPTGGYTITITKLTESDEDLTATVEIDSPADGTVVTQALTQPFHVIKTARSDKPVGFVLGDDDSEDQSANP